MSEHLSARRLSRRGLLAVRAGQVTPWDAVPRFSYAGAAPLLGNLATVIQGARKLT